MCRTVAMLLLATRILLLAALLSGCAKAVAPVSPEGGDGSDHSEPTTGVEDAHGEPDCARARCPPLRELETPSGHVRLDLCGECLAPDYCFLDPLVDLRVLPGRDPRPAHVFSCTGPEKDALIAELTKFDPPPRPRSCPPSRQRYWMRNGKRFICCLFNGEVAVECHAE
jgi:hypothetical protein